MIFNLYLIHYLLLNLNYNLNNFSNIVELFHCEQQCSRRLNETFRIKSRVARICCCDQCSKLEKNYVSYTKCLTNPYDSCTKVF